MNDDAIHGTIEDLIAEEHKLWQQESSGHADENTRRRLKEFSRGGRLTLGPVRTAPPWKGG